MAKLHTQRQHVYHTCQRCGTDQPFSKLRWQNGILVCQTYRCVDTAIIGSRDINVARSIAVWRHEFEPDPKLTQPADRRNDQFEVLY